jgi:hypothetical protein
MFYLLIAMPVILQDVVLCKAAAKKLRVRAGKIGGYKRWEGHSNFLLKPGLSVRSRAKILQPVVLPELPGKGPERKEAYLLA